jgi:hypothetical protein
MTAANVRRILATGVFAALLFSLAPDARACTCLAPPPPREALAQAAAVFEGKVTSVSTTPVPGSYPQMLEVELDVTGVWKGDLTSKTVVRTASNSAACGIGFSVGTAYLVYAHEDQQVLYANLCSRTTQSATAAADRDALGPSHAPAPAPPDETTGCTASGAPRSAGAALLVAALGLLMVRHRRRPG